MGRHRKLVRPLWPAATGATLTAAALLTGATASHPPVQKVVHQVPLDPVRLAYPPLSTAQAALYLPPLPAPQAVPQAPSVRPPAPVVKTGSGLVWPFETRSTSQIGRVDEGWDLVAAPGAAVKAVVGGTVHGPARPDPGGFGYDYAIERLDSPITVGGRTFTDIYYGHTHVSKTGHVQQGETIAHVGGGGYPRGGNGEAGEVEIGLGNPNVAISWSWGSLMKQLLS